MTLVVSVVFGLLIGGRLFYVLFYSNGYYFEHPLEIIFGKDGQGISGMSFHGGLVGGLIGGLIACRALRLSPGPSPTRRLWACRWPCAWAVARTL